MGEYKVINLFKEKHHDNHIYKVGDPYPVEGKKLIKTRAEELTKIHPEYGVAFLEVVEEAPKDIKPAPTKNTTKKTTATKTPIKEASDA